MNRYPMQPYPTSWYRILAASELPAREARRVHYFGRDLEVRRDASGAPRVRDASRPDGYPAQELNGTIAIFYDERRRKPTFDIPVIIDQADTVRWTAYTPKTWRIRTHVQEIAENTADAAHQATLHCGLDFPTSSSRITGDSTFHMRIAGPYDAGAEFEDRSAISTADFAMHGLGYTHVSIRLEYSGMVIDRELHSCFTPVDEEYIDFTMYQRTRSTGDADLDQMVHEATTFHFWRSIDEDIPIWENKVYRSLPGRVVPSQGIGPGHLCETEGDIARLRRWSRKFYTEEICGV
jgi:phenylpropionate dioxygenase-like ring-hydroxylating dioxygenase large terminal subunit